MASFPGPPYLLPNCKQHNLHTASLELPMPDFESQRRFSTRRQRSTLERLELCAALDNDQWPPDNPPRVR